MGPLQRAYHKEDFINVSRAVRKYHLLQVCSLIGVSLCGCVPKRGVDEQECTGYNLSMCKRKQKLSVRKNIGLRDGICAKKGHSPWNCTKGKTKQTNNFKMSYFTQDIFLAHFPPTSFSAWPNSPFSPQVHEMFRTVWQSLTNQIDYSLPDPRGKPEPKNKSDSPGCTCLEVGPGAIKRKSHPFRGLGRGRARQRERCAAPGHRIRGDAESVHALGRTAPLSRFPARSSTSQVSARAARAAQLPGGLRLPRWSRAPSPGQRPSARIPEASLAAALASHRREGGAGGGAGVAGRGSYQCPGLRRSFARRSRGRRVAWSPAPAPWQL